MNGGTIEKSLSDELTYDDLYSSDDNLWSLLFACGYLTLDGEYELNGLTGLRLPNEEMRMFFSKTVYDWFLESSSGSQDLPNPCTMQYGHQMPTRSLLCSHPAWPMSSAIMTTERISIMLFFSAFSPHRRLPLFCPIGRQARAWRTSSSPTGVMVNSPSSS